MLSLNEILESVICEETVNNSLIKDAMDKKYRVIINYNSHGKNIATGWRIIEVYAYGLTKAGNPVIRAYQPFGDTSTKVPSWKFFRVDRIIDWKKTGQTYTSPRPLYNPYGDDTMSVVYYNAKFGNDDDGAKQTNMNYSGPRKKDPSFMTDTERAEKEKMTNLKKQLENPIYLKDLQRKNSQADTGPKKKADKDLTKSTENDNLYKTDTERRIENLKKQLSNPIYLKDYLKNKEKNKEDGEQQS